MEGKKVSLSNMLLLALVLLMFSSAASARRPRLFDGPSMLGKRVVVHRGGEMACCNRCDCMEMEGPCTCLDEIERYCSDDCMNCQCGDGFYCRCMDYLARCPPSCEFVERVPGQHRAVPGQHGAGAEEAAAATRRQVGS